LDTGHARRSLDDLAAYGIPPKRQPSNDPN
jgi:hypothetical protein